jgi:hypothetical protein
MVTEPARFSRRLDLAVWALIGLLLAAVALDTVMQSRPTFGAVMLLTVAALALIMVLIGMVWAQGDDPAIRVIALGFLPVAVMALFPLARGLNLIPTSGLTRYGLTIGAALEMPILFYALSLRGTRRREAQVRASALSRTDPLTGLAHSAHAAGCAWTARWPAARSQATCAPCWYRAAVQPRGHRGAAWQGGGRPRPGAGRVAAAPLHCRRGHGRARGRAPVCAAAGRPHHRRDGPGLWPPASWPAACANPKRCPRA